MTTNVQIIPERQRNKLVSNLRTKIVRLTASSLKLLAICCCYNHSM